MTSGTNTLYPDVDNGGGTYSSSSNNAMTGSAAEAIALTTSSSSNNLLRSGFIPIAALPGTPIALTPGADVSVSSVALTWDTPAYDGNLGTLQAGSSYFIRVASFTVPDTFSDFHLANISFSTSGALPGAIVSTGATGLQPNTTYWARLWTRDNDGDVSYASNISTFVTLALPVSAVTPLADSYIEVDFTSATVQWIARPSLAKDVSSMTAEGYSVEASSTDFGVLSSGGVVSSSQTTAVTLSTLTVSAPALVVFKTYYFRVASLNWAGVPNWTVLGTTDTRFQIQDPLPGAPPYTAIDTGSIVANWLRNGNPGDTRYLAEVSTAADFSGTVTSTITYNLFYSTGGLRADTTYFFQVNATTHSVTSNWVSVGSTSTLSHIPAAAAVPFPAVNISSLTVRWLPNGNAVNVSTYGVAATTDTFYPNSDAGNVVLSSTRPAGADTMATLSSGLNPNTSYYLFVDALNWSGASSGFILAGSTATRPQPPTSLGFQSVSYSSAVAAWSVNGNPLGITTFTVVLSTVAAYPPGGGADVSVATIPTSSPVNLPLTGLNLDTTYYLFVTVNGFSYSAFAAGPSTSTLVSPPGTSPDVDTYTALAPAGFTLNWSSGSADKGYNPAGTTYYAQISLNGSFIPATSSMTYNLSADFSGLAVNTTYFAQVAAYSQQTGAYVFTNFGSTSTLANIPATAVTTFTGVAFTSMTVSWLPNGNPLSRTTYTVVLSPQTPYPNSDPNNVSFDTAPAGAQPMAALTGLNSYTTYYLFVLAQNNNGVPTSYAALGSTQTLFSPKTWVGGTGTSWFTAANWNPSGVPGPTDSVTIAPAANVSVTAAAGFTAVSFSSLTLGSPSGAFTANLMISTGFASAGSVLITGKGGLTQGSTQLLFINGDLTMVSGSSLTHVADSGVALSSINIAVAGTFDFQAGATIAVSGMGYAGGASLVAGSGPGGGPVGAASIGGGGGGHGGAGGAGGGSGAAGGPQNDSATAPTAAGSGGGGGRLNAGGAGGGAVVVSASIMNLNGIILSSGTVGGGVTGGTRSGGGGGAGGAVFLTAGTFSGSGSIDVSGGAGGTSTSQGGGGGGGGIVSIDVTGSGVTCSLTVLTPGGAGGFGTAAAGSAGTFNAGDHLAAPQNVSGTALSASSIQWSWSLTNGATDYQVFSTTGGPISASLGSAVSYTAAGLTANTTAVFYVQARACGANSVNSSNAATATLAAIPATAVTTFTAVDANSMSVAWTANGNPVGVTTYTVVLTTSQPYPNSDPENVSLSTLPAGASLAATLTGLDPNTTFYFFADARNHAGLETSYVFLGTAATLAAPPVAGASEFLSVQPGSVTVAWIAPSQPSISSMSNEGYILLASSNNFGALAPPGAPVFSSTTYNVLATTLTLSVSQNGVPLDLSNTYYFQVGSLNWVGQSSVTAFTKLNFQTSQSASLLHLGVIDPSVSRSTVSTSSMVVTNVGNWPVTLELSASTATVGGSPWTLGSSAGVETAVLMGVFNSGLTGPPATAFNTLLTGSTVTATASNYAANQNAVRIPSGQSRTLWFYFTIPSSSVSLGPETLQISTLGVYP
jgi:hypothetical protein